MPRAYNPGMDADPSQPGTEQVLRQVAGKPDRFPAPAAMAKAAEVDPKTLAKFIAEHHHLSPRAWLERCRLAAAKRKLAGPQWRSAADSVGFESPDRLDRALQRDCGMTAEDYARLGGRTRYSLQLPRRYRPEGVRGLLGRDADSPTQGLTATGLWKNLLLVGKPVRLGIEFAAGAARVSLSSTHPRLPRDAARSSVEAARRLLGLGAARPGERALRARPWCQIPGTSTNFYPALYADPFEALTWAIVGQQINLKFAATLVRRLTAYFTKGDPLPLMPSPGQLAAAEPTELISLQLSRAKAATLVRISRGIVAGDIDLEALSYRGVPAAREALIHYKGIGPWTAEYLALRGFGFADCLPVGDAGLVAGVRSAFNLDERPSAATIAALAQPFAPYRSLATHFLWRSTL